MTNKNFERFQMHIMAGKCSADSVHFCPGRGTVRTVVEVSYNDGTKGKMPLRMCLRHAVLQATGRMFDRLAEQSEARRRIAAAPKTEPRTVTPGAMKIRSIRKSEIIAEQLIREGKV